MRKSSTLPFIYPKRDDQCDVGVGHQTGNTDEKNISLTFNEKARDAKDEDKKLDQDNPIAIMLMHVQAIKLALFLRASAISFKIKLVVHNFTIFDL